MRGGRGFTGGVSFNNENMNENAKCLRCQLLGTSTKMTSCMSCKCDCSPFLFKRRSVQSDLQEQCLSVREMQVIKLVFEQEHLHCQPVATPKTSLEWIASQSDLTDQVRPIWPAGLALPQLTYLTQALVQLSRKWQGCKSTAFMLF